MMKIDWAALGVVAIVSIFVTLAFTALLSGGIRLVAQGATPVEQSAGSQVVKLAGYALLGLAGLLVLFGIYLLMPISG
ncbi:hypothetical protein MLP_51070 [Microlunatus phosphovorus NM-1]|uniref:Uncharacterized protein n=1 Tax=Microlunatus phosphovorus (strain ATCC 700054 / DSM 10555 / JCM 9379 / NBRC 101784 / NCIMB 13414 / VKM Ac-1990 / NM-1) TaxID=1032480 RepID=F5XHB3_MICPN|nr:hypothetical protein [Microlunatus phosphovorus]BAK38121.1 hypothetical protein MLP_51070 [Microlunatus phosphovorus NM-1]